MRGRAGVRTILGLCLLAVGVVGAWSVRQGAHEERAQQESGAPVKPLTAEQVPFDLRKVIERVHFAFRPEGSGWTGGHGTYGVRVDAEGLSVTPYHHPEGGVVEGAPVRFGAARLTRGEVELAHGTGQGRVEEADSSLTLRRGEVAEHYRNGPEGVEQSWSFARRPGGRGDLEVRLAVEGGRYVGESAGGLHFADARTGLGVRYGHGTWVDAEGRRTAVGARYEAGSVVLRVPEAVLEASGYPAVLDPLVTPEFGVNTPVGGQPAPGDQLAPSVASDGTDYLVVWRDRRLGTAHVFGARVSGAGALLDGAGVRISSKPSDVQSAPAVAYDGTGYLVVWTHASSSGSGLDILGARVSRAGQVLDPNGIPISTASNSQRDPAVSSSGTGALVVWSDWRGGGAAIYGARVSAAGQVLDASGIPISLSATSAQEPPAVASNGTGYLVAWADARNSTRDIYGARVSAAGQVLDASGIPISTEPTGAQETPSVASDGTGYLVVWTDTRNGPSQPSLNPDIYGARVSAAGEVLDASGLLISSLARLEGSPRVAAGATGYLVVWWGFTSATASAPDILAARVDGAGGVGARQTLVTEARDPMVARGSTDFLVVWARRENPSNDQASYDIQGARVNEVGEGRSSLLLSAAANPQGTPAVAFNGTDYLMVWADGPTESRNILGVRVSRAGQVLDVSPLPIAVGGRDEFSPAVASDGAGFLVLWLEAGTGQRVLRAALVSEAGGVSSITTSLSEPTLAITPPAVAFAGTSYLAIWEHRGPPYGYLLARRVGRTGALLEANPITLTPALEQDQTLPAVASDGTGFLVVWMGRPRPVTVPSREQGLSYAYPWNIHGTRVSAAGEVLDPASIHFTSTGGGQGAAQGDPAVASNGTSYLVAWVDDGAQDTLYAARVSGEGTVQPVVISTEASDVRSRPVVAREGEDYLVLWSESRDGVLGVSGRKVSGAGVVEAGPETVRFTSPEEVKAPAVASSPGQESLLAYARFDASTGADRVLARFLNQGDVRAFGQSARTEEDVPLQLSLSGQGPGSAGLSFHLVSQPAHGTLTGTPPHLTYTPEANYHGEDRFTFTVSEGGATSVPATVRLTVTAVNDAPEPQAVAVALDEDQSTSVTLAASDAEGDTPSLVLVSQPAHGRLLGQLPALTYAPDANFHGTDSFTFSATDGQGATSAPATVTLTVRPVNDAPVAQARTWEMGEDVVNSLLLEGSDVDGQTLTFTVKTQPTHGTLTGFPPHVTYTPEAHFHGTDSITYEVSDGQATATATWTLQVRSVNDVPVADPQWVDVVGEPAVLTLTGSDADGDPVTFAIASLPEQGTLTGEAPRVTYTPPEGFQGTVSFTFTVSDGTSTSAPAIVTLQVGQEAPPGGCGCAAGTSGTSSLAFLLLGLLGLLGRRRR
jgi:MYXO-CTERM domain-containing protein